MISKSVYCSSTHHHRLPERESSGRHHTHPAQGGTCLTGGVSINPLSAATLPLLRIRESSGVPLPLITHEFVKNVFRDRLDSMPTPFSPFFLVNILFLPPRCPGVRRRVPDETVLREILVKDSVSAPGPSSSVSVLLSLPISVPLSLHTVDSLPGLFPLSSSHSPPSALLPSVPPLLFYRMSLPLQVSGPVPVSVLSSVSVPLFGSMRWRRSVWPLLSPHISVSVLSSVGPAPASISRFVIK